MASLPAYHPRFPRSLAAASSPLPAALPATRFPKALLGVLPWLIFASLLPGRALAEAPRWIGVVLPLEAVDVGAQTAGRLDEVAVRPGSEVEVGQLLARIDSRTAEADRKIAAAELEMAEAELARSAVRSRQESNRYERRSSTAELWSEEEISSTEVEARSAEAEKEAAEARVERAKATVEQLDSALQELEIRAPFDGQVSIRYLDPGAIVSSGSAIVRLVSSEALLVRFAVPPEELGALSLGATVEVIGDDSPLGQAVVRRISPEIDLASQRIFVEALLDPLTLRFRPKGGLGVVVRVVKAVRVVEAGTQDAPK